jgi:hydroxymethylglutaryl-CoA synthase
MNPAHPTHSNSLNIAENISNQNSLRGTYGIDRIAFYTPPFYLDLKTLAASRCVSLEKYTEGLGQLNMAVNSPDEDIVTMGAHAAEKVIHSISPDELNAIDWLIFATESAFDHSKAAGIYIHELLKLPAHTRVIELKQACYSATAGIQLAMPYLMANPTKKVLLIASDIARYGLNTSGESSQGGGAVAMLLSSQPSIVAIEPGSGVHTEDVMDFWRPSYRSEALVEGKHSCDMYLKVLEASFGNYQKNTGRAFQDHQHFIYHIPLPRLAEKAHQKLGRVCNIKTQPEDLTQTLAYSRIIGNCYTAALYVGLISLLDHSDTQNHALAHQRIGFYSYGSGCIGEFFSGVIQPEYGSRLNTRYHQKLLSQRKELSTAQYEEFYQFQTPIDGSAMIIPNYKKTGFRLARLEHHKRIYEKIIEKPQAQATPEPLEQIIENILASEPCVAGGRS